MTRVFIETFGCQMNILDSELVHNQLVERGHEMVSSAEAANVVLFNTCSVRDLSEQKIRSRLGIIKQRKDLGEDVIVGVLGCMAERAGVDILKKHPHIDLLVGPSRLAEVPDLLDNLKNGDTAIALSNFRERKGKSVDESAMDSLEMLDASRISSPAPQKGQAYIRITRGCNKFCSFCVVPRTRGPEVHRDPDSILQEAKRLVETGALEITLLGQTINHYTYGSTSFADLLFRLHESLPTLPRLRFLTSHPRDFTDEALDVMASCERICKYLHIPAQSGSDDVLRRMNRGYTRAEYMSLIERAKKRIPNISIIGDMIVGFPGETDEDFEQSLSLIREVQYKNIFVFKYSPRPGTVADKRDADDIPMHVKKARHKRMLEVQNEVSLAHHLNLVGKTIQVMVEGEAKIDPELVKLSRSSIRLTSRTQGDHIVAFDGPPSLIGQLAHVNIVHASALALTGERVVLDSCNALL